LITVFAILTTLKFTKIANIRTALTCGNAPIWCIKSAPTALKYIVLGQLKYSETCISRAPKGTGKCDLYEQLPYIYRL